MDHVSESDVVVTTVHSPSDAATAAAVALAERLDRPFVTRRHCTIDALLRRHALSAAVVVGSQDIRLVHRGRSYGFHPNMAKPRIASLRAGFGDRFARVASLRAGDAVLDCTCGLGADAIVAAHLIGDTGRVSAVEASRLLAAIVFQGMRHYQHDDPALVEAVRRVAVVAARSDTLLPTLSPRSWDVVYFDPMFDSPLPRTKSLDLVRMIGSDAIPDNRAIEQARRVARRSVVVKDRAPGRLLRALGIPVVSRSKRTWFGRVDVA